MAGLKKASASPPQCRYCGLDDEKHLAYCAAPNCGRFFCNGTDKGHKNSHFMAHCESSGHTAVWILRDGVSGAAKENCSYLEAILNNCHKPSCRQCASNDIFVLGTQDSKNPFDPTKTVCIHHAGVGVKGPKNQAWTPFVDVRRSIRKPTEITLRRLCHWLVAAVPPGVVQPNWAADLWGLADPKVAIELLEQFWTVQPAGTKTELQAWMVMERNKPKDAPVAPEKSRDEAGAGTSDAERSELSLPDISRAVDPEEPDNSFERISEPANSSQGSNGGAEAGIGQEKMDEPAPGTNRTPTSPTVVVTLDVNSGSSTQSTPGRDETSRAGPSRIDTGRPRGAAVSQKRRPLMEDSEFSILPTPSREPSELSHRGGASQPAHEAVSALNESVFGGHLIGVVKVPDVNFTDEGLDKQKARLLRSGDHQQRISVKVSRTGLQISEYLGPVGYDHPLAEVVHIWSDTRDLHCCGFVCGNLVDGLMFYALRTDKRADFVVGASFRLFRSKSRQFQERLPHGDRNAENRGEQQEMQDVVGLPVGAPISPAPSLNGETSNSAEHDVEAPDDESDDAFEESDRSSDEAEVETGESSLSTPELAFKGIAELVDFKKRTVTGWDNLPNLREGMTLREARAGNPPSPQPPHLDFSQSV
ncbi:uncharacterized protein LOC129602340 [Paramacrobiotus metropolitanus]|uniref:uncharacterized protein LOC129602340 n=1 Tax=Paramacrobiotus metropolitanus TaxID=2943436 RepID=UPI00244624B5|nr:uncharacterized protein LOC129602340 [Paramacrobiotus metropolitanus]